MEITALQNIEACNVNIKKVPKIAEKRAIEQLQAIHSTDDGYICMAAKGQKQWTQYHYHKEEIEKNMPKILALKANLYMSVNSFYVPVRKAEYVRHINALYLDLDNHSVPRLTPHDIDSILYVLKVDYFKRVIPEPTLVTFTGRGIQMYWTIENLPKQGLPLWYLMEKRFIKTFENFDTAGLAVDEKCCDPTRVFRLAGSKNYKADTKVRPIYRTQNVYRLTDIIDGYFPELTIQQTKEKKKQAKNKVKIKHLYTLYSLHYSRLCDVVKLQEIRKESNFDFVGMREMMCFLYRYYSCMYTEDEEKALDDVQSFNQNFPVPLGETEVEKQTRSAEKAYAAWCADHTKGYNYKNTTLIKILKISEEEQKSLNTIIGSEERNRRRNAHRKKTRRNIDGQTSREAQKNAIFKEVKQLYSAGMKQKDIATNVGISRGYVSRILAQ